MDREIVEAREPFSVTVRGTPLNVAKGDRYWADDPLVAGMKPADQHRLFGPLQVKSTVPPATSSAVETMTAGPGERRRVTQGRTKGTSDTPGGRDA